MRGLALALIVVGVWATLSFAAQLRTDYRNLQIVVGWVGQKMAQERAAAALKPKAQEPAPQPVEAPPASKP